MKLIILYAFIVTCIHRSYSQSATPQMEKKVIDSSAYYTWPTIANISVSNDARFVAYRVEYEKTQISNLIIHSIGKNSELQIKGVDRTQPVFMQASSSLLFTKSSDTLGIVKLDSFTINYRSNVRSFKLSRSGPGIWVGYTLRKSPKTLVLLNLLTGDSTTFSNVRSFNFNDDESVLLIHKDTANDSSNFQSLGWVNLQDRSEKWIWYGQNAANFIFDKSGSQLAFCVDNNEGIEPVKSYWYYTAGFDSARKLTGIHSEFEQDFGFGNLRGFNNDGSRIFFDLVQRPKDNVPHPVKINVWSYMDSKLPSEKRSSSESYTAVIDISTSKISRLVGEYDEAGGLFDLENLTSNETLVIHRDGDVSGDGEAHWNPASKKTYYLVSTSDGRKRLIKDLNNHKSLAVLSPSGKFVIYYKPSQRNYFSYEVSSGIIRNITKEASTIWTAYLSDEEVLGTNWVYKPGGWGKDDSFVLLFDRGDIWQIDPLAKRKPINLTYSYGIKNNVSFETALDYSRQTLREGDTILLTVFDHRSKKNGFCQIRLGISQNPQITLESYLYFASLRTSGLPYGCTFRPMKAKNVNFYLIRRQRFDQYPNLYYTSDFKSFTPLTRFAPETSYNWYTTELHKWQNFDGTENQGLLYKPANFDLKKKYPIIFYYYEKKSNGLNAYLIPKPSDGNLNIPYYVSNGYLVFTPDIKFKIGDPGQSTYNSVVSAAKYLSSKPYIDIKRMGIQGQSLGGFETNYLVTHTNLFAAACSSSGATDLVSAYGSLRSGFSSNQNYYEIGQGRIGGNLWEKLNLYIKNSPILNVDKVITPLLLMHNTIDGAVPFSQAIEFFTGLRRLGKKSWLLEYSDGNHGLSGVSAYDFSIRMEQFFNHYLKGKPAPVWMTRGVASEKKGFNAGLNYDDKITTPSDGMLNR